MTEPTRGFPLWSGVVTLVPLWSGVVTLMISTKGVTCGTRAVLYKVHTIAREAGGGLAWIRGPQPNSHQRLRSLSLPTLETFLALNLSGVTSPPRPLRHLPRLFPP